MRKRHLRPSSEHAKELGNAVPLPTGNHPIVFLKPPTSFLQAPAPILLPAGHTIHHEVELAVVMGKPCGRGLRAGQAMEHILGYTLALDMTDRTEQEAAKAKGLPWTVAKGRDSFTPISMDLLTREQVVDPHRLRLLCSVNGTLRQQGYTGDMLFRIPALVEYVCSVMRLEEGDVILTGTPAGVGPLLPGDRIACQLETEGGQALTKMEFRAQLLS